MLQRIKKLSKPVKVLFVSAADFLVVFLAWYGFTNTAPDLKIFLINIGSTSGEFLEPGSIKTFFVAYAVAFIYLLNSGFYRSRIGSYESKLTLLRSVIGSLAYGITYSLSLYYIDGYRDLPIHFYVFISISCFVVMYAILNFIRDLASYILYTKAHNSESKKNVLIYGAGAAGLQLLNTIKDDIHINVVGLFDDSTNIKGSEISGYRVYGKKSHLNELKYKYPNLMVYLAIPSLDVQKRQDIIAKLETLKLAVRTMPGLHELVSDEKKLAEMQDLSLDDVLPRESAASMDISFSQQNIMITGAGGSIGSELVRQVIKGGPKNIVLYEISEYSLYKIQAEAERFIKTAKINTKIIGILGNVRSKDRLLEIIKRHKINTIYHAAAYKHVPIVEYKENIFEGIENNIFGTMSVCNAAAESNVTKVILVSTDKAVRPTNVMGATKRMAEMVAQSFNAEYENKKFCMVRFGNVLNSSGSVIPLFTKQIQEGGPITITHKDVTRFFMTIPEAANLVLQAGELSAGGEVFILNMGEQVKIYDLATRLIHLSGRNISLDPESDGIQIKEVGLRPGEKLYEELLISGDEDTTDNKKIFISKESFIDKLNLQKILDELSQCSKDQNIEKAINILEKSVEGYKQGVK
jgi:FlaA1/EpsC-like NDP-sugar epimerase